MFYTVFGGAPLITAQQMLRIERQPGFTDAGQPVHEDLDGGQVGMAGLMDNALNVMRGGPGAGALLGDAGTDKMSGRSGNKFTGAAVAEFKKF